MFRLVFFSLVAFQGSLIFPMILAFADYGNWLLSLCIRTNSVECFQALQILLVERKARSTGF